MARSFVESTLLATLPLFAAEWESRRRTYPPESPPPDASFFDALRAHVVQFLAEGRIAETTRFFYSMDRLLDEADPFLRDLLERDVVAALARDCRDAGIDPRRVEPYLGNRARVVWMTTSTGDRA